MSKETTRLERKANWPISPMACFCLRQKSTVSILEIAFTQKPPVVTANDLAQTGRVDVTIDELDGASCLQHEASSAFNVQAERQVKRHRVYEYRAMYGVRTQQLKLTSPQVSSIKMAPQLMLAELA